MTLIMALPGSDGTMVFSDSRLTGGGEATDDQHKMMFWGGGCIGVAGNLGYGFQLLGKFGRDHKSGDIHGDIERLRSIAIEDWQNAIQTDPPVQVGFLLVGKHGETGPVLRALSTETGFRAVSPEYYYLGIGSGWYDADVVLRRYYRSGMTVEQLAVVGMAAVMAAERNVTVGGITFVVEFHPDGRHRGYTAHGVEQLRKKVTAIRLMQDAAFFEAISYDSSKKPDKGHKLTD